MVNSRTVYCRANVDHVLDIILALFALYAPSAIGHGVLFDPYLQLLFFVSLVFGWLLISTTNLAGPLRYGYYQYKSLLEMAHPLLSGATAKVTAWAPLPFVVLALLPWFRTWFIMGVVPITWQFVREAHQRAISDVANRVEECCSKAKLASEKALSDAGAAKQHERDLEQNLRATNFYDESSVAWIAHKEFKDLAEARLAKGSAESLQGAAETERGVRYIRARTVADAADAVIADVLTASAAAQESLQLLADVRALAARARTATQEGWIGDAGLLLEGANVGLEAIEKESEKAAEAKNNARTYARDVYLTWQFVCEEHRREINNIVNRIDSYCSDVELAADRAAADATTAEEEMRSLDQDLRASGFYDESSAAPAAFAKLQTQTQGALGTGMGKVVAAVDKVKDDAVKGFDAAQTSLRLLTEVRNLRAKVKTAAEEGRTEDWERLVAEIEAGVKGAKQELTNAATAKKAAKDHARTAHFTWLSVREQHCKRVADVANRADKACIRAASYSALARAELAAAEQHEGTAHTLAAAAARDARVAQQALLTNLHGASAAAWAQLEDYKHAVKTAVNTAEAQSGMASDLQTRADPYSRDGFKKMAEDCKTVHTYAQSLQRDSETILENINLFKRAADKEAEGSRMQYRAAKVAEDISNEITAHVQDAADSATLTADQADKAHQHAVDAKAAIALDNAEKAEAAMEELNAALERCERAFQIVARERKYVQGQMARFSDVSEDE